MRWLGMHAYWMPFPVRSSKKEKQKDKYASVAQFTIPLAMMVFDIDCGFDRQLSFLKLWVWSWVHVIHPSFAK